MKRLSLTARIALASAGIVLVVLALALVLARATAVGIAERNIADRLETTQKRVGELLSSGSRDLAGLLQGHAQSPDVRSVIGSGTEYLDYAETAAQQVGADWVQLVSREGIRLAKSDDPGAPPDTLARSLLISRALDGQVAEGFGVNDDSLLIEVVAVPIPGVNRQILGAFIAAKQISDSVAREVGEQTESEVLFYVLDSLGAPRVAAATTNARNASVLLLARLSDRLAADSGVASQAGAPAATSVVPGARDSLERVQLAGETWVGSRAPITTAAGVPIGGFLALRSLDRELDATGFPKLQMTLLLAGGGGLLLALIASVITARQVARPVTQLANATRRAAEGDYQAEIPEGGSDEIGTLASAFRRLVADLRDKQALVDFLSASASGSTRIQTMVDVNPASTTTVKIPTGAVGVNVLAPGQTFGNRYEIKSVLGVGGMGMVYKANDRELGEVLAIKALKPELVASDSNALERFKSEIKLARRIAHRNVVRTYDLGEIGGQYYITMEYVEGKSLKDLIRERGRLPASIVLPIAKQLCRALEVSHDEGVIHRDIKPQNMVVQGDGVLKVMDFGIARLATRPRGAGHTEAGMVVGTPEYMAPEQLLGDELDARADLYATGVVLYECLVGTVPITAETPIALIARVLEDHPRPPKDIKPDIPQALSDLIVWVLAKDRENRPRSAAELHARLDDIVLS
jgi:HAMP domain-containing protein/predicted Ser/Thr protein kinase